MECGGVAFPLSCDDEGVEGEDQRDIGVLQEEEPRAVLTKVPKVRGEEDIFIMYNK